MAIIIQRHIQSYKIGRAQPRPLTVLIEYLNVCVYVLFISWHKQHLDESGCYICNLYNQSRPDYMYIMI